MTLILLLVILIHIAIALFVLYLCSDYLFVMYNQEDCNFNQ
ncbi:MAG: hypothetical protein ICV53_18200 [Flavisolibacter sp.]|nr:hypothetical protein [Flavisolibacter sp.]